MKQFIIAVLFFLFNVAAFSQNVGIGTTTPGFPLNFATTTGDKISLYGNSGSHYGFGIQGGLLQIHSDAAAANIVFGYGSSSSFTERMRIINSGLEGMTLDGRLTIRSGQPSNAGGGGGVWLTKPDNSALLGFMGTQNSQNIGFFGGAAGWGFTYDAINSRVGIGNNNPNAPLAFAPSLGKKITLYPGTSGDAGFGIAGNRLQIYADNPNADVAIGYDAAGTFNEKFAVKPTGALAVNSNTGIAGQVLTSNGASATATWSNVKTPSVYTCNQNTNTVFMGPGLEFEVTGLNSTFFLNTTSTVVFMGNMNIVSVNALATSFGYAEIRIIEGINNVVASARSVGAMDPLRKSTLNPLGSVVLGPGTYTVRGYVGRLNVPDLPNLSFAEAPSQVIVQVFPN